MVFLSMQMCQKAQTQWQISSFYNFQQQQKKKLCENFQELFFFHFVSNSNVLHHSTHIHKQLKQTNMRLRAQKEIEASKIVYHRIDSVDFAFTCWYFPSFQCGSIAQHLDALTLWIVFFFLVNFAMLRKIVPTIKQLWNIFCAEKKNKSSFVSMSLICKGVCVCFFFHYLTHVGMYVCYSFSFQ